MFKNETSFPLTSFSDKEERVNKDPADIFLPNYISGAACKKEEQLTQPSKAQFTEVHECLKIRPLFIPPYQFGQDALKFIDIVEVSISLNGLIKNDPQKAIVVCQHMDPAVVVAIRRFIEEKDYYNTKSIYNALLKLHPVGVNDHCPVLQSFRKQRIGEAYAEYGENLTRYARNCSKPGRLTDLAIVRVFIKGLLNEEARRLLQYQSIPPKNLAECYEQLQRSVAVFPHFGVLAPLGSQNRGNHRAEEGNELQDECKYCKKKGHAVENCFKLKKRNTFS